jgi:two-component system chemotaxis sensor kinase CheA
MSIDMEQFHQVFFDESQEHLDTMEQLLMEMDLSSPDMEALNSVFRAAHSIKGGSGIFGFDGLGGLTHVMESLLDKARNGEQQLSRELVDHLLQTLDVLKSTLDNYRSNSPINQKQIDQAIVVLEETIALETDLNGESNDEQGVGFFENDSEEHGFGFFTDESPSAKDSGSDSESIDGFGFFDEAPEPTNPVAENKIIEKQAKNRLVEPPEATVKDSPSNSNAKSSSTESKSIRVDTVKVDLLVNLIGELVITQSMLAMLGQTEGKPEGEKLEQGLIELERNTRELQEAVMSMRMLPVSFVFNRFPRLVRDLATKLDKKVELCIEGGTTEVDKGLIEKLVDPLTHLVRNSIDHGIETVEKRLEAGKSESGTVILRAEQRGGSIEISITDDGAGLNRERILSKAAENGLACDPNMPDSKVWDLIFEAGFSTAAEVTDVSGRGVGMDVVRRNIEGIGGRIEIESTLGQGSVFHIHLPLTLAIVDGMCVSVGDQIFVVPLVNIVESIQPSQEQIKLISNDNLLWIREQYWPLIPLYKTMEIDNAISEPDKAIVVLIESSKKRFALLVDGLVGQQQVVIKSLEKHYKRVTGVAGATIMGDGGVAMILDVESLAGLVKPSSTESKKHD